MLYQGRVQILAAHYQTLETFEFRLAGRRVVRRKAKGRAEAVFGPGFCDLQCNGFAGVDFNRSESEPEIIAAALRALWEHGCTEVLPTIITATPERMEECLRDLVRACALDADVARSVPGFHLEGPFISAEEGARGAHPAGHVRAVDRRLWRRLQRAAEGHIRLVTLAPEQRGVISFITQLRTEKVLPAIGHTLADAAMILAAVKAGALMSTHLGNGCPQMVHRHRNPIFAQLGEDALAASFIADGAHLPPEVLRAMWRAKGAERSVLVSDAMAAAAAPPGIYSIGELEMEVGADRIVRQPGSANLAGSALTMPAAVAGLVQMAGVPLAEAWDAAAVRPWALLRRAGGVKKRSESCVIADWRGGELKPLATLRGNRVLWSGEV